MFVLQYMNKSESSILEEMACPHPYVIVRKKDILWSYTHLQRIPDLPQLRIKCRIVNTLPFLYFYKGSKMYIWKWELWMMILVPRLIQPKILIKFQKCVVSLHRFKFSTILNRGIQLKFGATMNFFCSFQIQFPPIMWSVHFFLLSFGIFMFVPNHTTFTYSLTCINAFLKFFVRVAGTGVFAKKSLCAMKDCQKKVSDKHREPNAIKSSTWLQRLSPISSSLYHSINFADFF